MFMAGIFPEIVLAIMLALQVYIQCRPNLKLAPSGPVSTWKERLQSPYGGGVVAILFSVVMGGIYLAFFPSS